MLKEYIIFFTSLIGTTLILLGTSNKEIIPSTIKNEVPVRGGQVLIDPALYPYYIEFAQRIALEGINPDVRQDIVSITMGRLPSGVLGIAMGMWVDNAISTIINIELWNELTPLQKRALVWHELAHDVFNVEHGEIALMATSMDRINPDNIEEMINELIKYVKDGRKKENGRSECSIH